MPGASDYRFELVCAQDLPMLHDWLLRPHVAQWRGPAESIEQLHADHVAGQGAPGATLAYIASLNGEPVGFIQSYVAMGSGHGWWEDVTDPGVRGIDQFLAHADEGLFTLISGIALPGLGAGCKAPMRSKVGTLQARATPQTAPRPGNPKGRPLPARHSSLRSLRVQGHTQGARLDWHTGKSLRDPEIRVNRPWLNQGMGRAMVRAFTAQLLADPAVSLVQTDPSPVNARAIRCYVRAGFQPVREVITPDGAALLMRCVRTSLDR
ncbi:GNAT family N-acetyltransferase [Acidovorax sp. A1169]|nr:GNAT family N-acetyltransferase [Acidovorax sp. A1169]